MPSDPIVAPAGGLPEPGVVRSAPPQESELALDTDLAAHVAVLRTATAERIAASGGRRGCGTPAPSPLESG